VVTVTDPVTGRPIQQIIQTVVDPKTGQMTQEVMPLPAQNGSGGAQIVTVTDPVTGRPVQKIVQMVIDPITGQANQVMTPMNNMSYTQNGVNMGNNQFANSDGSISQNIFNGRGKFFSLTTNFKTFLKFKMTIFLFRVMVSVLILSLMLNLFLQLQRIYWNRYCPAPWMMVTSVLT
jgi:hypothetical protein